MPAGDTLYVDGGLSGANPHTETVTTALTVAPQGQLGSPNRILCVDNAVVPPTTLATTATITSTMSGQTAIGLSYGFCYFYGMNFIAPSTGAIIAIGGSPVSCNFNFAACTFQTTFNSSAAVIRIGQSGNPQFCCEFRGCSFVLGSTAATIFLGNGNINLIGNTYFATGAVPLIAFYGISSTTGITNIRDSDLSIVAGTLFSFATTCGVAVNIANCALAGGVTLSTGTANGNGQILRVTNSDSAATNYKYYMSVMGGSVQQETTTIRSGGDTDGVTPLSWRVATGINAMRHQPFPLDEMAVWNTVTGSAKTLTVEIAGATSLTNADIWMEVEYPGSASTPMGGTISNKPASLLATPTTLPTSTATWVGSPSAVQRLQVTFTPLAVGLVKVRVFLGKASATVYIDPIATIT